MLSLDFCDFRAILHQAYLAHAIIDAISNKHGGPAVHCELLNECQAEELTVQNPNDPAIRLTDALCTSLRRR